MLGLDGPQPEYEVSWKRPVRQWYWLYAAMAACTLFLVGSFAYGTSAHHGLATLTLDVRFYTQNIRFDNKHPDHGEQLWGDRKHQLILSIDLHAGLELQPVVVGLQEVLHNQLEDILDELNRNDADKWTFYGKGRDDGHEKGEYAPVLYQKSQWKLKDKEVLWLLPTPDRPSKGWDAALNRVVTVVSLQLKLNPLVTIKVLVTHFDHAGEKARRHAAEFIADIMTHAKEPAFLLGDLNTTPQDQPYAVLSDAGLTDSKKLSGDAAYGEKYTFTGFNRDREVNTIIDYVWAPKGAAAAGQPIVEKVKDTYTVRLQRFGVLANFIRGHHFSDHRPVVADYQIERNALW